MSRDLVIVVNVLLPWGVTPLSRFRASAVSPCFRLQIIDPALRVGSRPHVLSPFCAHVQLAAAQATALRHNRKSDSIRLTDLLLSTRQTLRQGLGFRLSPYACSCWVPSHQVHRTAIQGFFHPFVSHVRAQAPLRHVAHATLPHMSFVSHAGTLRRGRPVNATGPSVYAYVMYKSRTTCSFVARRRIFKPLFVIQSAGFVSMCRRNQARCQNPKPCQRHRPVRVRLHSHPKKLCTRSTAHSPACLSLQARYGEVAPINATGPSMYAYAQPGYSMVMFSVAKGPFPVLTAVLSAEADTALYAGDFQVRLITHSRRTCDKGLRYVAQCLRCRQSRTPRSTPALSGFRV